MSDEKYLLSKHHFDKLDEIFLDHARELMKKDRALLKQLLLPILYDQFNRPIFQEFTITGQSIRSPIHYKEE